MDNPRDIQNVMEERARGDDVDVFSHIQEECKTVLDVWVHLKERTKDHLIPAKVSIDDTVTTGCGNAMKTVKANTRNGQRPLWSIAHMESKLVQDPLAGGETPTVTHRSHLAIVVNGP